METQAWWHKAYNPNTGREAYEFKASLGDVVGLCLKSKTSEVDSTDFEVRLVAQEPHFL